MRPLRKGRKVSSFVEFYVIHELDFSSFDDLEECLGCRPITILFAQKLEQKLTLLPIAAEVDIGGRVPGGHLNHQSQVFCRALHCEADELMHEQAVQWSDLNLQGHRPGFCLEQFSSENGIVGHKVLLLKQSADF